MKRLVCVANVLAFAAAIASTANAPWNDTSVSGIARLPQRCDAALASSERDAADIASFLKPRTASEWTMSLDGKWRFDWKRRPDASAWELENAEIAVPGCWQLPACLEAPGVAVDPPIYTNIRFPHTTCTTNILEEPGDKSFTSMEYRDPTGRYRRSFTLPEGWSGRRIIIHFDGFGSCLTLKVNGKFAGYAEDGRLPAEFDITPCLATNNHSPTTNHLEVEVLRWCDGSFLEDQDFWRLSGLFRSVWLSAEAKDGVWNVKAESDYDEATGAGTLDIEVCGFNGEGLASEVVLKDRDGGVAWRGGTDASGRVRATVAKAAPWSDESPTLYTLLVRRGRDWTAQRVGFRRVEIRDGVLRVNGRRILMRGVNRHEMDPRTGYTVTRADMERTVERMKDMNINAVRTSHYPCASDWYGICDEKGIYVLSEANVESHELSGTIPDDPRFLAQHVERVTNMIARLYNHPSVVVWSIGNEAGFGANTVAAWRAAKAADPHRPVQYEPHSERGMEETDIFATGYHPPEHLAAYARRKPRPAKPYIAHEYAHAMGNSSGDVHEYWRQYKTVDILQGGFIWDLQDQALEKNGNLAYGGDFGDRPNDSNFNCNGLYDARYNPHPGAFELKHAMQPVDVVAFDAKSGKAKLRSVYSFRTLDGIDGTWSLKADGCVLAEGAVPTAGVAPSATTEVALEGWKGPFDTVTGERFVTFRFREGGREIASDQVFVGGERTAQSRCTESFDEPKLEFKLNTWRALTDSDRGAGFAGRLRAWRDGGSLPEGAKGDISVTDNKDGSKHVKLVLAAPEGAPVIPRVGVTFTLPADFTRVKWYGRGPWENYPDRNVSSFVDSYSMDVDELNDSHYVRPSECGYRTDVRRLSVSNGRRRVLVTASGRNFNFNVWPWSQRKLEDAGHEEELVKDDFITVNIDSDMMGIGGDHSWGAWPHDRWLLKTGKTYTLEFDVAVSGVSGVAD